MAISMKLAAKEIFLAGCKHVPFVGPAVEVVDNIAKAYETLHMQKQLAKLEKEMTNFDRKMRDFVKGEIGAAIHGLTHRDLAGPKFTILIKNLFAMKQNGWLPALFQGLLERSVHWAELCNNPSHYGSVLSDRDVLDLNKLQVFIDTDKTRILELTPIALHALLARQCDDGAKMTIATSQDVWAFVDVVNRRPTIPSQDTPVVAVHLESGASHLKKKDYEKAIVAFTEAIGLNANHPDAYAGRALSFLLDGDYDAAIADFTAAICLQPGGYHLYVSRGTAYAEKKEYDRAIADYTEAIRLNSKCRQAYRKRGTAYIKKDEYGRAIADFTEAIRLDPKDALAYQERGMAYLHELDIDRADADMKKSRHLRGEENDYDTGRKRGLKKGRKSL